MRRPRAGEAGFKPAGARRREARGSWFRDGTGWTGILSEAGKRAAGRVMLVTGVGMARDSRAESRAYQETSVVAAVIAFARRFGRRAFGGGK